MLKTLRLSRKKVRLKKLRHSSKKKKMNTLILYATQYGFTADCAARLKELLAGDVTLVGPLLVDQLKKRVSRG